MQAVDKIAELIAEAQGIPVEKLTDETLVFSGMSTGPQILPLKMKICEVIGIGWFHDSPTTLTFGQLKEDPRIG